MCGTDYNKNIPKVGPKKAYFFITTHGSLEKVEQGTELDLSILNYPKTRELFQEYKQTEQKVPYCGQPDFEKLRKFGSRNSISIPPDDLVKAFCHSEARIIIEEE